MAAEASLVDSLKHFPDILKVVPDNLKLPALAVLVLLVLVLAILPSLKMLPAAARTAAVMTIIRYAFIGTGAICLAGFTVVGVSIKSTSAEVQNGITKPGPPEGPSSRPRPIVPPESFEQVSDLLAQLPWRFNPPPGINEALAEAKAGNTRPAANILRNTILPEQKDDSSRARTFRQIALLEFYSDTQASLADYRKSVEYDSGSWEAWGQIANLLERSGDHDGATTAAQKVVDIGTKDNDLNALGVGNAALGYVEANQGNIDAARSHLDKARGYFLAAGSKREYAAATNNVARLDFFERHPEDARREYEDALSVDTAINNPRGIAADYAGLARPVPGSPTRLSPISTNRSPPIRASATRIRPRRRCRGSAWST
jgi:tetratricopeptide (TPR) repeat protein